eukprot:TRINITY_DN68747_c0_g1_i2.p2 TRINITY_DN68747_c0_g1~~TRINITY_DN68747_c0_g1_i2.p2  ORF type:complete len:120 (-),score=16.38 TRINITY_DN68747_c0_g1_i2:177-536(-)
MVKDGRMLIAETKANGSPLSKWQKKGGIKYLEKQLTDLSTGIKGKGRYKNLEGNADAKKLVREMKKYLKEGKVDSELFRIDLEEDDTKEYYPVKDKKRCKSKGKIVGKKWPPKQNNMRK